MRRQADGSLRYANGGARVAYFEDPDDPQPPLTGTRRISRASGRPSAWPTTPPATTQSMALHNSTKEMTNRPEETSHEQSE